MEKAAFGAGCFWGIQAAFDELKGVTSTQVGYMGGTAKNPSYKEVCTGKTGHAETVEIVFDPSQISFEQLLETFWKIHDPSSLNRQKLDFGTQYRSVIFYYNESQRASALKSKEKLEKSGKKIVTQIVSAGEFFKAEAYHQKYYLTHPGVC